MKHKNIFLILFILLLSLTSFVSARIDYIECPTIYNLQNVSEYILFNDEISLTTLKNVPLIEEDLQIFNDSLIISKINITKNNLISFLYAPTCENPEIRYTDYLNSSSPLFNEDDLFLCYDNINCNSQNDYLQIQLDQKLRVFGIEDNLQSYLFLLIIYLVVTVAPFVLPNEIIVLLSGLMLFGIGIILIGTSLPLFLALVLFFQGFLYITQIN